MSHPLSLDGRIVLITGGAQGIGQATAELVAERGGSVVIADYNAEKGEAVAAAIRAGGGTAHFFRTDVREDSQVRALLEFVREKHGRLDTMICAAGVLRGPWETPESLNLEDWHMTIEINVTGPFLCAKYATPMLEASGRGIIVIIASGAGVSGPSSSLAYGASKGGANGLGMTLANHLAPRGIRVNTLCPGNIITDMKMSVDLARARKEGKPDEVAHDHAKQNYGLPPGVAKVIGFMISDEADYLRGNVFTR